MNKEEYIKREEGAMLHTYNRFPVVLEKGEGVYLYDTDGKKYLDFAAGIAVEALGYGNRKYNDALKDQIDKLMHTSNLYYNLPIMEAAEKILKVSKMDRVFFTNSGTEAIEGAIKAAKKYAYTRDGHTDHEIIAMNHSFHGRSLGALSVTGNKHYQEPFEPLLGGIRFADFNDLESVKAQLTDKTCAILFETVQGEGGIYPATQEFIEGLRKLCDERGMLLLLDEVQTGWGRTGSPMAFMGYGVKPDCVTMAKAMGGGMPIGACCASEEVAAVFTSGTHGSTYGGHPLACAASLASISEILDRDLSGNAKVMGEYMKEKLAELPHVKEARGKGLLVGCEYDIPIALEVKWACFRRRLLITAIGDSVNRMIPPLILAKEHVDQAIEIMRDAINEAAAKYEADQKTA